MIGGVVGILSRVIVVLEVGLTKKPAKKGCY